MHLVYLDTGINKNTDIAVLKYIHNQFLRHHKTHTVSLLCEELELNPQIIKYINTTTNWELAIQGWEDVDYLPLSKDKIGDDVDKCILKIEELFNVTPERWYVNHSIDREIMNRITEIAFYHGVDIDSRCEHISVAIDRLENRKNLFTNTVFFNSQSRDDLELLSTLFFLTR